MVSIRMTAKGFQSNKNMLNNIIGNHDEELAQLFHKLGEDIVNDARNNLQNNTNIDSGSLLASIRILDELPGKYIIVGSDEEHAVYIEFGRGPVRPKDPDGWLHWIDKETGKDVFAKFAKATEPSPFLQPAIETNVRKFSDIYVQQNEILIKKNASSMLDVELLD